MTQSRDLTDAELQAKVAALSGALNLRKQQQETPFAMHQQYHQGHQYAGHSYRGGAQGNNRWSPFPVRGGRGRGRGAGFQNRSLVLNSANAPSAPPANTAPPAPEKDLLTGFAEDAALPAPAERPVKRHSGHNQTVARNAKSRGENAGTDARHTKGQARAQQTQTQEENKRLATHFEKTGANRTMEIEGIRFLMKEDGSKLIRLSGEQRNGPLNGATKLSFTDSTTAKKTPYKHTIAGVEFQRTKTGNLLRVALKGPAKYVRNRNNPTGERCSLRRLFRPASKPLPQCEHFIKNGISNITLHTTSGRLEEIRRYIQSVGKHPFRF